MTPAPARAPVPARWSGPTASEYSAGGVAVKDGKLLLVRVQNLQGVRLWTFPKGHLERGETPRQAALREVLEETGWDCRIQGNLATVRYRFIKSGRLVRKRVRWYRMEPRDRSGSPDGDEVFAVKWAKPAQARRLLRYPGDLRLVALIDRAGSRP